jgi:hypothetical protein
MWELGAKGYIPKTDTWCEHVFTQVMMPCNNTLHPKYISLNFNHRPNDCHKQKHGNFAISPTYSIPQNPSSPRPTPGVSMRSHRLWALNTDLRTVDGTDPPVDTRPGDFYSTRNFLRLLTKSWRFFSNFVAFSEADKADLIQHAFRDLEVVFITSGLYHVSVTS